MFFLSCSPFYVMFSLVQQFCCRLDLLFAKDAVFNNGWQLIFLYLLLSDVGQQPQIYLEFFCVYSQKVEYCTLSDGNFLNYPLFVYLSYNAEVAAGSKIGEQQQAQRLKCWENGEGNYWRKWKTKGNGVTVFTLRSCRGQSKYKKL